MALFSREEKPTWLEQACEFCRTAGISIAAWGPHALVVEAKSPERAAKIAKQLANLGFKAIEDQDGAYAGLLTLSPKPEAVRAKITSFDISRRPWSGQMEPLIWALGALLLFRGLDRHSDHHWFISHWYGALLLFSLHATRIWGWRMELLTEGLHVRRRFRWVTIPWNQIRAIESRESGNTQER
jgi:hypothetical protein